MMIASLFFPAIMNIEQNKQPAPVEAETKVEVKEP
jgi:hypothetical protein